MRGNVEFQWPRFDSDDYALLFRRVYSMTNDFRKAHGVLISSHIELGVDGQRLMRVLMGLKHNPVVWVAVSISGRDFAEAYIHNAIYGVLNMWERELQMLYSGLMAECRR